MDMDGEAIINALSMVLTDVMHANEAATLQAPLSPTVTKFCSSYSPAIPITNYLNRIRKYAKCSDSCFIVALIYIDRVINSHKFSLTGLNVHRMLLTSLLLSAKFLDDTFYNNTFYAQLGGIPLTEMNGLELEFLSLTRFDLHVTERQYGQYYQNLKTYLARSNILLSPIHSLGQCTQQSAFTSIGFSGISTLSDDKWWKTSGGNVSELGVGGNHMLGLAVNSEYNQLINRNESIDHQKQQHPQQQQYYPTMYAGWNNNVAIADQHSMYFIKTMA